MPNAIGKRFNVFVSEEAHKIIKEFQKKHRLPSLDMALDQFILNHGEE